MPRSLRDRLNHQDGMTLLLLSSFRELSSQKRGIGCNKAQNSDAPYGIDYI
jgi:hypothetical protein